MLVTEVRLKGESEHVVVPHEEIKRLVERNEVDGIFKYGTFEREFVGEEKAIHVTKWPGSKADRPLAHSVLTTASPDRDQDVMNTSGMILTDNYLRNPVVLPMHMHGVMPVGMTRRIKQSSKTLWAEWEWLTDQGYTMADTFRQAWDAYVLNCVSIGFLPLEIQPVKGANRGFQFDKWELVEHSAVIIPAHREAMRSDEFYESMVEAAMGSPSPILKGFWNSVPKSGVQVVVKALDSTTSDSPIVTMTEETVSFSDTVSTNGETTIAGEVFGGDPSSEIVKEEIPVVTADEIVVKAESPCCGEAGLEDLVEKPYPEEHSCRIRAPIDFESDSFRRMTRKHGDKEYSVIMAKLKGQDSMTDQAYRYPKGSWSSEQAREHCLGHKGSFEAAGQSELETLELKNKELQDALDVMAQKNVELSERAARAEAESNKAYTVCAALSARVIQRGGVQ